MSPLRPLLTVPHPSPHQATVHGVLGVLINPFPSIYLSFYLKNHNQPPTEKWRTTEKCAMVSYWKIGLDVVLQLCPLDTCFPRGNGQVREGPGNR